MIKLVRPLRSGQITIPADLRRKLGITDNSVFQISLVGGELRLKPIHIASHEISASWLQTLYMQFAPVRKEAKQYTEKEINDTIDTAVTAVREQHV